MQPLATVEDVEANYRPLRGQEITNAGSWLATASAALRIRVGGIDDRVALEPAYADLVSGVVTMAVIRLLRGADPRDTATYDAVFFSKDEIDSLIEFPTVTSRSVRCVTFASPWAS